MNFLLCFAIVLILSKHLELQLITKRYNIATLKNSEFTKSYRYEISLILTMLPPEHNMANLLIFRMSDAITLSHNCNLIIHQMSDSITPFCNDVYLY